MNLSLIIHTSSTCSYKQSGISAPTYCPSNRVNVWALEAPTWLKINARRIKKAMKKRRKEKKKVRRASGSHEYHTAALTHYTHTSNTYPSPNSSKPPQLNHPSRIPTTTAATMINTSLHPYSSVIVCEEKNNLEPPDPASLLAPSWGTSIMHPPPPIFIHRPSRHIIHTHINPTRVQNHSTPLKQIQNTVLQQQILRFEIRRRRELRDG